MSTWFSIISDEAIDLSQSEHLSLPVRWVDKHYAVHEILLAFSPLCQSIDHNFR